MLRVHRSFLVSIKKVTSYTKTQIDINGHLIPIGKYYQKAHERLKIKSPNLFICGHSHICLVQMDKQFDMLWMNPGACGFKGFHQVKTLLRFSITKDKIHDLEVIELGKRV